MNKVHILPSLIAAVAIIAAAPAADAGDFWDFLRDAWEKIQRRYTDNEESANELEDEILASAQNAGAPISDPEQYRDYAEKLAMTLSRLTSEQQDRVFNPR